MSVAPDEHTQEAVPADVATGRRLSRAREGGVPAPVRIVHLGAGAFFRSHQAWYTHVSEDAHAWGIAAFTGRRPQVAEHLAEQDGLYTVRVQAPSRCTDTVVSSVSAAHASTDLEAWAGYFRDPKVAVVTCTVTEHGYLHGAEGSLLDDSALAADIDRLASEGPSAQVVTAPAKIVAGLVHRRDGLGGTAPLAVVPCDNLTDNGGVLERVVLDVVGATFPAMTDWTHRNVSFVSTVVDRITPHTTSNDRAQLMRDTGIDDPAMVTTEPYAEWVMSGAFPHGRPAWESAGASVVPDVTPFAQRKLHLLNGAHSLMAYAGSLLGHAAMSDAMGDDLVRRWATEWWDVVVDRLGLPSAGSVAYCESLVERFSNPMIRHPLAQTATDGSQKLAVRVVPVLRAELERGTPRAAATRPVAAWICYLRGLGAAAVRDVDAVTVEQITSTDQRSAVGTALSCLGLPSDQGLTEAVDRQVDELAALSRDRSPRI